MVDKLWYDWQHTHPANFWSYRGGADTAIRSAGLALSFPNGAPPFLNVSLFCFATMANICSVGKTLLTLFCFFLLRWITLAELADTRRWYTPELYHFRNYEYYRWEVVLRLRMKERERKCFYFSFYANDTDASLAVFTTTRVPHICVPIFKIHDYISI